MLFRQYIVEVLVQPTANTSLRLMAEEHSSSRDLRGSPALSVA
jgi:hypothetical protein